MGAFSLIVVINLLNSYKCPKFSMPAVSLRDAIGNQFNLTDYQEVLNTVPSKYQKHDDCVVFNTSDFDHVFWTPIKDDLWSFVAKFLNISKIAVKSAIVNDDFRSPTCRLVMGNDPWVVHKDNGIKYCFDITKSMFCFGNISEKLRVAIFNCVREVVVDMFAGIGYFTLPYLVHAKAHFVYACEWNPVSCEALRRALRLNKVHDRCVVLEGDNRKLCPRNVADRVNMGLIPECSGFYETACNALRDSGGILHIHLNVTTSGENIENSSTIEAEIQRSRIKSTWKPISTKHEVCLNVGLALCIDICKILERTRSKLFCVTLKNVVKVKNYAPHIQHFVFDLSIEPLSQ